MFQGRQFTLEPMTLPPGRYYARMARPSDQNPTQAPGSLPNAYRHQDTIIASLNQVRSLVSMLDSIFQAVHPTQANMAAFGGTIRNLLILASTECEAQWRGVLVANNIVPQRPSTTDYVKLAPAMRLREYGVSLRHFPWLPPSQPFGGWDGKAPTKSLPWYDDYNAAKHDREGAFSRASLQSAINAVSAVWIMIAAQFGHSAVREFDDLERYFELSGVPRWPYVEVYTPPYAGFDSEVGPIPYPL